MLGLAGLLPAADISDEELAQLARQIADVYHAVEQNYADPVVPEQVFYGGAIPGLIGSLDPFSAFLDPDQFRSLKDMQQSVQKGFGSVVSLAPGRVVVLQTLPGTPSARAGLSAGDEIVEINGYRIDRLELEHLVELLRQSRQRQAQLLIRRPGVATLMSFTLIPAELASPSVSRAFFLRPGVGYIKIESFDDGTAAEFGKALDQLGAPKLQGLVLDLRDNPGGVMPSALEIAARFLKPGQPILTVRGRSGPPEEVKVPDGSKPLDTPLAVLVNGKTASASEIVAGAWQDHKRAVIVGEPTFGKGLVQRVFDLSESTGLALTTAYYFTPNGRSIQRPVSALHTPQAAPGQGGITPDEVVPPENITPFRAVLEGTSSFLKFAQEYHRKHPNLPDGFEVSPELLDEFQHFLSERQIRPGVAEWSSNREWIRIRLKTEIYNLAFGVEKGDEIDAQRDVQIQRALQVLRSR
jgi:carboxyl-terminal processing protease